MAQTVMEDRERRVLSHLSIPRNVDDLSQMLRVDRGYAADVDSQGVYDTLKSFEKRGWVVNLGEHDDLAKLAHEVERSDARTMPDEKAEIFAERLSADHLRWRVKGDVYMYTDAGRDASRESTQLLIPPPKTPSEIQATIDAEWARVVQDFEPGSTGLGNLLLEDEFRRWATAVADECERVWNVRPRLPIAGGSQFSNFYENLLLDAENQKTALGAVVDPWFMALVETTAVTDADTGSTIDEPEYTGYARKSVAGSDMAAASGTGGSVANTSAIVFAACTSGTDTIIGFAHCVAATTGNIRKFGTCSSTVVSTTQTPAQFAIGAYTTTIA